MDIVTNSLVKSEGLQERLSYDADLWGANMRTVIGTPGSESGPARAAPLPDWKLAYRIPEACAATGYKRSKLYELIKAGKITIIKDGCCTLILRSELERYLDSLQPVRVREPIPRPESARRRALSEPMREGLNRRAA
jgi:excisionase family DNA binding protein